MKKRISTIILSLAMMVSCLFMFTSCGKDKYDDTDDNPAPAVTISSIAVELATDDYSMTNSTITLEWGKKVAFVDDDFTVTATKSDQTTAALPIKTGETDGYTLTSTIPADDITPIGDYKLTFAYTGVTSVEISVKVVKKIVNMSGVTWNYTSAFVFNGAPQSVTLNNVPEGITAVYQNNAKRDVGEYTATASFVLDDQTNADNYVAISDMTLDWEIKQAVYPLSLAMTDYVFDGTSKTAAFNSTLPTDVEATVVPTYTPVGGEPIVSVTTATKAGRYPVTYSFEITSADASNYEEIPTQTFYWEIDTAPITGVTMTKPFVYTGLDQSLLISDFSGLPNGVSIASLQNATKKDAGTTTVTLVLAFTEETEGCYAVSTIPYDWTISPVALTIKADNKEIYFNDPVPTSTTLTYTGMVNNEDDNPLEVLGGEVAFDFGGYTVGSAPNDYVITISGLTSTNYTITFQTGTLTVKPIEVSVSTLTWDYNPAIPYNYTGTSQLPELESYPTGVTPQYAYTKNLEAITSAINAANDYSASVSFVASTGYVVKGSVSACPFVISPVALTIKADNKEIYFNDPVPTSTTLTYTGMVNNEDDNPLDVLGGEVVFDFGGYTVGSVPNDYVITVSGLTSTNYTITFQTGTLTVKPIEVSVSGVTWNYSTPFNYSGTEQKPTLNNVPEHITPVVQVKKGSDPATSINAGNYTASVTFTPATGYAVTGTVVDPISFVISPVALTIKADNKEIYFNDPVPTSTTLTYTGMVNNEDDNPLEVLGGEVAFDFGGYTVGSAPNDYVITISGLTSTNYTITFQTGTLTVKPIEVSVSGVTWNYSNPYIYNGSEQKPTLNDVPANVTPEIAVKQGIVPANSINVGNYTASVTFTPATGYAVTGTVVDPIPFVISPATVDESKIYWMVNGTKAEGTSASAYIVDNHSVYLQNDACSDLILEPTMNHTITDCGYYNYSYSVYIRPEVQSNYNTLTKSSYVFDYIVNDIINEFEVTYVSLQSSEGTSTSRILANSSSSITNGIVTAITPVFVEGYETGYVCNYYSDKDLQTPINFEIISTLPKIYVSLEREVQGYENQFIGARQFGIDIYFNDQNGRSIVVGKPNSFIVDANTFEFVVSNTNSLLTEVVSQLDNNTSIELLTEQNQATYNFAVTYNSTVYAYETQITIIKSPLTNDFFTSFTIGETNVSSNVSEELPAETYNITNVEDCLSNVNVEINPDSGYQASDDPEDAPAIELINGEYFLKYTLVPVVETFSTGSTKKVFYIKLNVRGEMNNDTSIDYFSVDGKEYDIETLGQINIIEYNNVSIVTTNEYAKIEIFAVGSQTAMVSAYGRLNETLQVGTYSIVITATDGYTVVNYIVIVDPYVPDIPDEPERPDPEAEFVGSVIIEVSGKDMLMGDLSSDIVYDEDANPLPTITLSNWNAYNTIFIEAQHSGAMLEIYTSAECEGETIFTDYGEINESIPAAGTYYLKVTSANGENSQIIKIVIQGDFKKLGEATYNDVVAYTEFGENTYDGNMMMTMDKTIASSSGFDGEHIIAIDNIGKFTGFLGKADAADIETISADEKYFTFDKFSSAISKYMCKTANYQDLYDSTNTTNRDLTNVKLRVYSEEIGGTTFEYVHFFLAGNNEDVYTMHQSTPDGYVEYEMPIIYKITCEIKLYLNTQEAYEEKVVYPTKITIGSNDYNLKLKPTEWYDFGGATLAGNSSGEFAIIQVEESSLGLRDVTGETYKEFDLTFTWSQVFDANTYVLLSDTAIIDACEAGTTLSALINAGMAFKSVAGNLSKTITLRYEDGFAMIAVTDESGFEIIPIYIVTENFDYSIYDGLFGAMPNAEKFEISVTLKDGTCETASSLDADTQFTITDTGAGIHINVFLTMTEEQYHALGKASITLSNIKFATGDTKSYIQDEMTGGKLDISGEVEADIYNNQYGLGFGYRVYFNGYIPVDYYVYFAGSATPDPV